MRRNACVTRPRSYEPPYHCAADCNITTTALRSLLGPRFCRLASVTACHCASVTSLLPRHGTLRLRFRDCASTTARDTTTALLPPRFSDCSDCCGCDCASATTLLLQLCCDCRSASAIPQMPCASATALLPLRSSVTALQQLRFSNFASAPAPRRQLRQGLQRATTTASLRPPLRRRHYDCAAARFLLLSFCECA
jgi:hypothetical protein